MGCNWSDSISFIVLMRPMWLVAFQRWQWRLVYTGSKSCVSVDAWNIISSIIRVFHKHTELAMLASMPILHPHIFAVSFFITRPHPKDEGRRCFQFVSSHLDSTPHGGSPIGKDGSYPPLGKDEVSPIDGMGYPLVDWMGYPPYPHQDWMGGTLPPHWD